MRRLGCKIIDRNLRLSMGEIDLLCEGPSGGIIVVEVKARQRKPGDTKRIEPEASITAAKKTKLRTLAKALTKQPKFRDRPIRIDVIAVVFDEGSSKPVELRHYESAV
jgi:putative endonuclease